MAFVTVERLGKKTRIPKKTYEKKFKKLGYKLVSEDKTEVEETNDEVIGEVSEKNETKQDDELETTPISEMNKEQLVAFAKKHNIDTRNAKNVTEARKIIQKHIRDSKM